MRDTQSKAWRCTVCGYVHHGPNPPDDCPVCGVDGDLFEPVVYPRSAAAATAPKQWRCLICGYIHDGPEPPDVCPVCGATADSFEPYSPAAEVLPQEHAGQKVVIIGAGVAGVSAAEAVRKTSSQAEIVLISKEAHLPYYRLNLTRYLAGEVNVDQLILHPQRWYEQQQLNLLLGVEVQMLNLAQKRLILRDGRQENYDKLILTAGSHPFMPPFPGLNRENVFALRTKADAEAILAACRESVKCVCIGGGLLGLETAGALVQRGVDVTLIEGYDWLLPRQLNRRAGELLEDDVKSIGISLRKNAQTQEIVGDERVCGVLLKDGVTLAADVVIIATGVRPNSYLARQAGLMVNTGVVVNNLLQTAHPDVLAAGDIAEHGGITYGLWGPAQLQGATAGMNAAGEQVEFIGMPRSNMLKVLGYDMFSIGQITAADASYTVIDAESAGKYACFVFRDNLMVGSILLGDITLSAGVKKVVEKHLDCSKVLQKRPGIPDVLDFLAEVQ